MSLSPMTSVTGITAMRDLLDEERMHERFGRNKRMLHLCFLIAFLFGLVTSGLSQDRGLVRQEL